MLLWHGSRLTNWTGILKQGNPLSFSYFPFVVEMQIFSLHFTPYVTLGLRIAPPEAPVTGYMFGKGVYFADMFSKSANYCCSTPTATSGVLLLCEVVLLLIYKFPNHVK